MSKMQLEKVINQLKGTISEMVEGVENPSLTVICPTYFTGEPNKSAAVYARSIVKLGNELGIDVKVHYCTVDDFKQLKFEDSNPERCILLEPSGTDYKTHYKKLIDDGYVIDIEHLDDETFLNITKKNYKKLPATVRATTFMFNIIGLDKEHDRLSLVGCNSTTVGRYLTQILPKLGYKVSLYNSVTQIKPREFAHQDFVISCTGSPHLINKSHFSKSSVCFCVDLGCEVVENKVVGDFDTDIKDIPGILYTNAVGKITTLCLLLNLLDTYEEV